jgi:hypothetical protein
VLRALVSAVGPGHTTEMQVQEVTQAS